MGKYEYIVEVIVANPNGRFKATSVSADSLYAAVDLSADKLSKQFLKLKSKLQDHKKFSRSKQAKLKRLNPMLEFDNSPYPQKKSA
jgi:ribosome-associated translation inhibitor RaiA